MPHGKSNPKRGQESLGKALQRRRAQEQAAAASASSYDVDGSKARGKMTSVLEASNLDDFISSAMMSERAFESHKENTVVLGPDGLEMSLDENGEIDAAAGGGKDPGTDEFDFEHMNIPRRPAWTAGMTAEDLDYQERKSFLEWRRGIANAEEKNGDMKVTPFEKNLEVWRQLWRVIERSDLVCQLVDARNPLFYYSTDLEAYAREIAPPKPTVVVVNKADYLSRAQQREWARHFNGRGVAVLFFSARQQQEQLNREAREERDIAEGGPGAGAPAPDAYDSEDGDDDTDDDFEADTEGDGEEEEEVGRSDASSASGVAKKGHAGGGKGATSSAGRRGSGAGASKGDNSLRVLSRLEMCVELERLARTLGAPDPSRNGGRACVGMVGFPNVGKSSLINVMVGATPLSHGGVRVSVGATPGKTKHFQTLVLSDSLMLCDCPGLVFPSFVSSTAEMICAGVLPIMQMRNVMPPMALIARRIPRHILEITYTIKLPVLPGDVKDTAGNAMLSPQQLLESYCQARGLFRARALGESDMPRAARQILKDFTDGRLLFCHPPADLEPEAITRFLKETDKTALKTTKLAAKLALQLSKAEAKASAGGAAVASAEAASLQQPENIDLMAEVLEKRAAVAAREAELGLTVGAGGRGGKLTKREMGLLRWGKKDRKVGNKDPYGNPDVETAASLGPVGARVAGGGKKGRRGKKRDGFVRNTMPHHQTYSGPAV
ncbi:Lsg1, cytoplasmic GTPase involved in the ribosome assembly [Ectocarpus siliculosus]|uniref:Lsg1, cytoplasmic GTPase involved in the ribosome assembly n=1 Tax=Ectocarpus siliculosus TaxID=2880 RepID=D7G7R6_ECTSI|nr:Lsg1, cytoplasmic GTPase involved in the ribosome assembly [Ectocarpus siliculosus]|eukprot:CBJ27797.1 Lsg1, cytoplasmic GTPase involved in the ribosome assembly [Ectocarpus siliculosus]